ncbi:hypothetical protein [Aquabacterium sp.]|uniref:hypothetical protein n=1 Tax=Aquabacterium sp. TaxID=1872578 RepID=UPI0035B17AEA
MNFKHAITAGLGVSVRLRSADPSHSEAGAVSTTQNEAAGHHYGTTAAIGTQHPDFASLDQTAPAMTHRIKFRLIHCAAWLALIFRGVA